MAELSEAQNGEASHLDGPEPLNTRRRRPTRTRRAGFRLGSHGRNLVTLKLNDLGDSIPRPGGTFSTRKRADQTHTPEVHLA